MSPRHDIGAGRSPLRSRWVVPGPPEQVTGGYLYDALMVRALGGLGDRAEFVSLAEVAPGDEAAVERALQGAAAAADVVVIDGLAIPEVSPGLGRLPPAVARVLLVHHLQSWELPAGADRDRLAALEEQAARRADRVLLTSQATAARLLAEHPHLAGRLDVVHPGADRLPRLPPARRRPGQPVELLFVGSPLPRKRLPLLLHALDNLRRPGLRLRLLGDPARDPGHAAELAVQIAASPYLASVVTWLGPLDDRGLAQALARADALVLPSALEGYGMVLGEALYAGVPVIAAAAAGGVGEAAGDGSAALWFDEPTVERGRDLVRVLAGLLDDPAERRQLRRRARAVAATLPRWAEQGRRVRAALQRAVSQVRADPGRAGAGPG